MIKFTSIKDKALKSAKDTSDLEREEVDERYQNFLDKIAKDTSESRAIVSYVLIVICLERIVDHMVCAYEALIYMVTERRKLIE